jgi:hypothetical protein
MPSPQRSTVLSLIGFAAVLCLAVIFRSQNADIPQTKQIREFGDGEYGDSKYYLFQY